MKQRVQDRLAGTTAIALLTALAAGTYYLAEFASPDTGQRSSVLRHEPDYFVDGLAMIRLNAQGAPVFRMAAAKMRHYPDDGSSEFDSPKLVSLDPTHPTVHLSARSAKSDRAGRSTDLIDDVLLLREASAESPQLTVETDFVTVDSDTETARTDRPVRIVHGRSTLTGVGMEFNNAARLLRLDSEVRGVWLSPQSARQDPTSQ